MMANGTMFFFGYEFKSMLGHFNLEKESISIRLVVELWLDNMSQFTPL